jgi:hypothetical protein
MYKSKEELVVSIDVQVNYETRWLRRIPLMIGVFAAVVACIGYCVAYWKIMTVALFILVIGFSAQAILWFGLKGSNKLR